MLYRSQAGDLVVYRSTVLDERGVAHAFGTRHGDERAITSALSLDQHTPVRVRQVHGAAVHVEQDRSPQQVSEKGDSPHQKRGLSPFSDAVRCDADAIVLQRPGSVARILTADCVPILLARTDGTAVAAVHAGWRGLVAGVIRESVAAIGGPFVAAVGPCMGVARFEVGEEVAGQFAPSFVRRDLGPKPHVDLSAAAHAALIGLGAEHVDSADLCTYSQADDFFSHRRDVTHGGAQTTGRMVSVIAI